MNRRIAILGSTGSVGVSTLDVVRLHPDRFRVTSLAAHSNTSLMLAQCLEFKPERVVMVDSAAAIRLRTQLAAHGLEVEVSSGVQSLDIIAAEGADVVVCAIVGAVGLASTLAAVNAGLRVLIANKEPLVMLGSHIMALARRKDAVILPLDSEHNAIFQCLPDRLQQVLGTHGARERFGIQRLLLTGSGGPFRTLEASKLGQITVEQACAHPNWQMGRKISVDSATMMNKGLELIEACALFSLSEEHIQVVIHPQSVVHSIVEYVDGSMLAQMAAPDMKVPIANALAWPERISSGSVELNLFDIARLDFEPPDEARFPALTLAREAARSGGTAPAMLNAANEVAVAAFLNEQIRFDRITDLAMEVLEKLPVETRLDLETALAADNRARELCATLISSETVKINTQL